MSPATTTARQLTLDTIPLASGSTLYHKRFDGAPRIALGMYIHGGNRVESHPGVADMVDDLLSEGTAKRSAEQIAVEMDGLSLDLDMDTRRDYSLVSATFLEEDLDPALEMMSDLVYQSTLADFEKEKTRLQGELIMDLDSPKNRAHDLLMTRMLDGTPYRASHGNILAGLSALTDAVPLHDHYAKTYQPQNAFFISVGDIAQDVMQQKLEQYFVCGKGDSLAKADIPGPASIAEEVYATIAHEESNQLNVYRGWYAPPMDHPDYPALAVLNTILGAAGLTSRLFLELRDKQGLAYTVRSQYEASRFLGLFHLYIGTDPNNREKVLKGFETEIQKLIQTPVGAQELAEAQENMMGRRVVFLETAPQQASYIGSQLAMGLAPAEIALLPERLLAVTSDQIQTVAQKYLTQPSIVAAVGPSRFL